jgi:hypothetical protein
MNAPENDPTGFERRLAAWLPAPTALDRDRMLFDAGRASARAEARGRVWTSAAVVLTLLLVGMGTLFARERSRCLALQTMLAARPAAAGPTLAEAPPQVALPARSAERPGPNSYLVLTMRLGSGELDIPPASPVRNAAHTPDKTGPQRPPLRPRAFERLLDL